MPKSPEGGYVPSPEEEKKAYEMMTPEEKRATGRRLEDMKNPTVQTPEDAIAKKYLMERMMEHKAEHMMTQEEKKLSHSREEGYKLGESKHERYRRQETINGIMLSLVWERYGFFSFWISYGDEEVFLGFPKSVLQKYPISVWKNLPDLEDKIDSGSTFTITSMEFADKVFDYAKDLAARKLKVSEISYELEERYDLQPYE